MNSQRKYIFYCFLFLTFDFLAFVLNTAKNRSQKKGGKKTN